MTHKIVARVLYAVTDHQGTVHALVDSSGAAVERYRYDAWGNVTRREPLSSAPSAPFNRFLFHGREYSYATGFYNFRARWYDPAAGRWLSKDPIGLAGGLNLYEFCGNCPTTWNDPKGTDITMITDPSAVYGNGHAAAITGPVGGKYRYDSFGKRTKCHRHGQYEFDSYEDAMKFAKDKGYSRFAKWYTSENQTKFAQEEANAWHSGPRSTFQRNSSEQQRHGVLTPGP